MARSKCQCPRGCTCTNLSAHYQHIDPGAAIDHQWDKTPSEGPSEQSAPFDQECPLDAAPTGIKYPAVYTYCNRCGYTQTSWP